MKPVELHERIAAWRSHRGCTLQVMADACGMTRQAMSLIVAGERDVRLSTLSAICTKAFRVDLATFFGPLPGGKRAS